MAFMSQETKKKVAPEIQKVLAQYGVKGSISVDNHSSLVVTLKSGEIDFKADTVGSTHYQVNTYWIDDHYVGKARCFLNRLVKAMKGDIWFDKSDAMVDYFNTAYYIDINIGRWNKEYEVIS